MLLFNINMDQVFAIGTLKILELVPYTALTSVPQSHPSVLGAASIRGNTIPVIDMARAIGCRAIPKSKHSDCYIIVTDCQRMKIGFLVYDIQRIIECNWRDIKSPPENLGSKSFVTGVAEVDKKLVQLLDVELLLSMIYPEDKAVSRAILTDVQREMVKPCNILLVDDSFVARKQLSDALDGLNIPYYLTSNGQEALDIMQRGYAEGQPIHILVSDIEMPGLDGYELTFEVKNRPELANAYIILHTSISSEISVGQAKQVGADEALTKFDVHELTEAILRGAAYNARLVEA
ncbi:chemotaxis protein CheW [Saccharobesus litoralis]|uniref:Chemotaxis protein CheW n=1 Tax=Saccharobesus litoralis TaxID=2172099 RepID=A0A2S0VXV4_9ALTE|nr:chemotaxis protein [Saccharobesus litoralis]AWB69044.1 chemotaxis protein CheW [Saccharobesus litoralis]